MKQAVEAFAEYNVVLKFATIPPASLVKVADHFSYTFHDSEQQTVSIEQKNLEIDIDLINSFITSVNLANGTKTVRWDKDLLKSHSKRRGTNKRLKKLVHYRYVDLYDGLHPHMALSQTWCSIMCKSISSDLLKCEPESKEEEYEIVVEVEEEEVIVEIVDE